MQLWMKWKKMKVLLSKNLLTNLEARMPTFMISNQIKDLSKRTRMKRNGSKSVKEFLADSILIKFMIKRIIRVMSTPTTIK